MHSKKYLPPILALSLAASLPTAFAQLNQTVFFDDGRDIVGYNGENFVGDINSTNPPANGFNLEKLSFRYNPVEDYLDIRITTDGVAGDVDGNGDPDTGPNDSEFWIGESLAFAIDMDCDGTDDFSFGMTPFNSFKEREAGEIILVRGISTNTALRLNLTFTPFFNLNGEDIDAGIFLQLPSTEHPDAIFRLPDWSLFGENPEQFRATAYLKADQDSRDFDVMQVNVNTNYPGPGNIRVGDDVNDVGLVPGGNPTTGWDLTTTNFEYDPFDDTMKITQKFNGVAGDADGDDNPDSSTHPGLPSDADRPNLSGSETIAIAFDFDDDDTLDTVIGVPVGGEIDPADLTIRIADFDGPIQNLGEGFGADDTSGATARLEHNPSAANPDFIVIIDDFSKLHFTPFQFSYRAFAGSQADSGYGEDNQVSDVALEVVDLTRSEEFSDFADVGNQPGSPNFSGWDIQTLDFKHDPTSDKLSIRLLFYGTDGKQGIPGDADGDGDPASFTRDLGGEDYANLGAAETITVSFDTDQDGTADIVVGVPSGQEGDLDAELDPETLRLKIAAALPTGLIGSNYGADDTSGATAFATANPSDENRFFEIQIFGWSLLDPGDPRKFNYRVFAGSLNDGGIGEDFAPNASLPDQATALARALETPSTDVNPSGESFVDVIGDEDTQYKLTYRTTIPEVGAATQAAIRIEEMLDGNISNDGTFKTDSIGKAKICFEFPPGKRGFGRIEAVPVQSN